MVSKKVVISRQGGESSSFKTFWMPDQACLREAASA